VTSSLTGAAHSTAPGLERDIASFARHLRAANLSPKTVRTYLEAAGQLTSFLVEGGRPATLAGRGAGAQRCAGRTMTQTRSPPSGAVRSPAAWKPRRS